MIFGKLRSLSPLLGQRVGSDQFSFRQPRIVFRQRQAITSSFRIERPLSALNLLPRPFRIALRHDRVICGRLHQCSVGRRCLAASC